MARHHRCEKASKEVKQNQRTGRHFALETAGLPTGSKWFKRVGRNYSSGKHWCSSRNLQRMPGPMAIYVHSNYCPADRHKIAEACQEQELNRSVPTCPWAFLPNRRNIESMPNSKHVKKQRKRRRQLRADLGPKFGNNLDILPSLASRHSL